MKSLITVTLAAMLCAGCATTPQEKIQLTVPVVILGVDAALGQERAKVFNERVCEISCSLLDAAKGGPISLADVNIALKLNMPEDLLPAAQRVVTQLHKAILRAQSGGSTNVNELILTTLQEVKDSTCAP